MASPERCPICHGAERRRVRVSRAFLSPSEEIAVCAACGHGELWPVPGPEELARAYADAYGAEGQKFRRGAEDAMRLLARRDAAAIARALPAGARRVLDVGAGRGVLANALAQHGVSVTAVERSREAATSLDARVDLVIEPDFSRIDLPERSFGAVVFRHVLEHLYDPVAALARAHALLATDGVLLVEVPNFGGAQARMIGDGWMHLDPPRHLHHFTRASLTRAVTDAGFRVREVANGSVVHDVMGWMSGLLARVGRDPHGLYRTLHAGAPLSVVDVALGAAALPLAVPLSIVTRRNTDAAALAISAGRGDNQQPEAR